jgi:hypothetical protein
MVIIVNLITNYFSNYIEAFLITRLYYRDKKYGRFVT